MNASSRKTAVDALPLEQTYLSLDEAFAQAIELEIMLARHKGQETHRSFDVDGPGLRGPALNLGRRRSRPGP